MSLHTLTIHELRERLRRREISSRETTQALLDRIVVIDPFADDCVVVTGSHNLGYQASYNNDENLLMIKGNKKLAMAYATHVLDVYDHFAWRWTVNQGSNAVDAHLKTTADEWLNKYFDANGKIHNAQLNFWMQAAV